MRLASCRALALAGAAAALLAGALLACAGAACAPPAWETAVLDWLHARRTPATDVVFAAATWLGSLHVLVPLALAGAAWLVLEGRRLDAIRYALAFGGATLIAHALKPLVGRARPDTGTELLVAPLQDASFPSAHAMQVTAFVLATLLAFVPHGRRPVWAAPAAAVIAIVGVSRLYLQVHFPSDVLSGTAAGALWVLAIMRAGEPRHA